MTMEPILAGDTATLSEHRRYPGCRLQLVCSLCGWSNGYDPERVITRLQQLRAGGHPTTLPQVAARVGWDCPRCHRAKWKARFAWPEGLQTREIKRLTNPYRN
jgi:hypothetical protein